MKLVGFFAMLLVAGLAQAESKAAPFRQAFESYLEENLGHLPGYAVGVVVDGDEAFSSIHGVRKLGTEEKIDADTVFRLASVSKTFTPAAVALMGPWTLHFDSTIGSHLPDLQLSKPKFKSHITARHILSQSSGLMPHAYTNLVQDNVPYKKILGKMDKVEFVCLPGNCYGYQNVVYSLMGDVLASAGKSSYEKIVDEKLFQPLGMKRSSFGREAFMAEKNRATPHRWDKKNKQWKAVDPKDNYYQLSPAAGANASLNDMMAWLDAQLGKHPKLLSKQVLDDMHRPHIETSRKLAHYGRKPWDGVTDMNYALGWRTFNFKGEEGFVHHGGWVEGVRTEVVLNRRLNMGMVFLSHSESAKASDVVPMFIRTYMKKYLKNSS